MVPKDIDFIALRCNTIHVSVIWETDYNAANRGHFFDLMVPKGIRTHDGHIMYVCIYMMYV